MLKRKFSTRPKNFRPCTPWYIETLIPNCPNSAYFQHMNKPSFYNKTSIFIFSILLTGVGGSLIMGYNLRKVGKTKVVLPLVLIVLVVNGLLRQVVKGFLTGSLYEYLIPNIFLGLVLAFPIWNNYLWEFPEYESKKPWIPLIVTVVLFGGTSALVLLRK